VADDQIYRLTYDGQVADEHGFAAMGGSAESVTTHIKDHYREGMSLQDAVRVAVEGLGSSESGERTIPPASLEVAVLDRTRFQQRKFRRLSDETVAGLLAT
jgi:proteasome alpha subunit